MGSDPRSAAAGLGRIAVAAATTQDLLEVCALERVCYDDPWPSSAFVALPGNQRVYFAVARWADGGRLAGYVIGWHVMDEAELANLAVEPSARGRGIGARLLAAMLADAQARGATRIFLEVRESNVAARKLYESQGFEQVGRRSRYYSSPVEDALVLRRPGPIPFM
jgi:[ribosomal protein S18]-alanine N-acetyltransferase